jgi:hypothetical protein
VEAKLMANTIEITVKVRDDLDKGFDSTRRKARQKGEQIGEELRKGQDEKSRGIFGKLLDRLSDVGEAVVGKAGQLGVKMGGAISDGLGNALSNMPPQVQAGVLAIGATAASILAPLIAAAITAGVLLAVGGGVLVAGIVAAIQDPKVSAAWTAFGERAKKAFEGFGQPFQEPLIRAADTFGDAIERMAPAFDRMGEKIAPIIDLLAPKLAEMAEKSLPGIEKAVEASIPLFEVLAEKLPEIGEWVSKILTLFSENAPEAALAFGDILDAVMALVSGTVVVIAALTRMYGFMRRGATNAAGVVRGAWNSITSGLTTAITRMRARIIAFFAGAGNWLYSAGVAIVRGIVRGIYAAGPAIRSAVRAVIPDIAEQFIPGFAHGGISGGGLIQVGERGREILQVPAGTRVFNNDESNRMLAGNGSDTMQLVVSAAPGTSDKLVEGVLEMLRFEIRRGGGLERTLGV